MQGFLNEHCKICVQYRAMGPGPNIVDICSRVDKTKFYFQTPQQILSQQQTDQFICLFLLPNVKSSCCVLTMQKLSKPVRTKRYQLQEIKICLPVD